MIVGNIYSFGKSAGFAAGSERVLGLSEFIDLNIELGVRKIEIPFDFYFNINSSFLLKNFVKTCEQKELSYFIALENYSFDYLMYLNRNLPRQERFVRVKISRFYGGNRHLHSEMYRNSLLEFRLFMSRVLAEDELNLWTILIENHQDVSYQDLEGLLDQYKGRLALVWDTGNSLPTGLTPQLFSEHFRSSIKHIHLKDYQLSIIDGDLYLARCVLGLGHIDVVEVVSEFSNIDLSIELGAHAPRVCKWSDPAWWNSVEQKTKDRVLSFVGDKIGINATLPGVISFESELSDYKDSINVIKRILV